MKRLLFVLVFMGIISNCANAYESLLNQSITPSLSKDRNTTYTSREYSRGGGVYNSSGSLNRNFANDPKLNDYSKLPRGGGYYLDSAGNIYTHP